MKSTLMTLALAGALLAPAFARGDEDADAAMKIRCGRFFQSQGYLLLNDRAGLWNVYTDIDHDIDGLESYLSHCVCMKGYDTARGPNGIRAFQVRVIQFRVERACRAEGY